jgi:hypothetical protein
MRQGQSGTNHHLLPQAFHNVPLSKFHEVCELAGLHQIFPKKSINVLHEIPSTCKIGKYITELLEFSFFITRRRHSVIYKCHI